MAELRTIDDVSVRDKTVIVRVDLNSPIDPKTGLVIDNKRIAAHAETLRKLAQRGARVVVIAHQGRKGDPEFTTLEEHSRLLSKHTGSLVSYVPDIIGSKAESFIRNMKSGEIVLLENLRTLDEETADKTPEEHSQSSLVRKLANLADYYVLDAFSIAHRNHASVVGFSFLLPSFAGELLAKELAALNLAETSRHKVILLMGGNKPEECVDVIEEFLLIGSPRLMKVLSGGVLGDMFLKILGHRLGNETEQFLAKKGFDKDRERIERITKDLGDKLVTPVDVAYESDGKRQEITIDKLPAPSMIFDIGRRTAENFGHIIATAAEDCTIIMKGTPGVYERGEFRLGSKMVYEFLAKSRAFTLIGGGDSSTALQVLGINPSKYSYVSLGGGALIRFLAGKSMPGIDALKKAQIDTLLMSGARKMSSSSS